MFVTILDLLGFKRHLRDENGTIRPNGLADLYERYFLLLDAKHRATVIDRFQLTPSNNVEHINTKVQSFVASDTLMLWSNENEVNFLIIAVANLVNQALLYGAPLRGAIAYGDCILESSKRIFLGYPVVDAVQAEQCQEWIGVGVLPSAAEHLKGNPAIVEYTVPIKPACPNISIRHALAWHWAEETPNAPEIRLRRLMGLADSRDRGKYQNAIDFITGFPET
ncbi:MAG: hypothetical protein ACOZBW_10500 [Thermodesulfobacteriota bacterium]